MLDWLTRLFDGEGFPARWNCGIGWTRTPFLGWLHILSDLAIWGAYMAIPLAMWYFARRRKDLHLPRVFWLYVAFILSCGIGHLIEAGIFYWPVYRLSGLSKLTTAAVSWATLLALIKVLPMALSWPGLAKMNAELKREITWRQEAEAKLERANGALSARNQEMQRFLYSVSHDLKSPVVTTKGFAGFIRSDLDKGRTDRLSHMAGRIEEASDQMTKALGDLLTLGRLGYVETALEPVAVQPIVEAVVDAASPAIEQAGAEVIVAPGLPAVRGDASQLRRLFQNLLDNALSHGRSPDRPQRVWVGGESDEQGVRYWVADNGPGIAAQDRERVFRSFERLNNTAKGTGLGLSIVKRIVENHRGRVWIESPRPQGEPGTVIRIAFPAPSDEAH